MIYLPVKENPKMRAISICDGKLLLSQTDITSTTIDNGRSKHPVSIMQLLTRLMVNGTSIKRTVE